MGDLIDKKIEGVKKKIYDTSIIQLMLSMAVIVFSGWCGVFWQKEL